MKPGQLPRRSGACSQPARWAGPGCTPSRAEGAPSRDFVTITWESFQTSGGVRFTLLCGTDTSLPFPSAPITDNGSYTWQVSYLSPFGPDPEHRCRIRIFDASGLEDTSDFYFTIAPSETFRITNPNGGEVLSGPTLGVSWDNFYGQPITVELQLYEGLQVVDERHAVGSDIPSDSYTWNGVNVPDGDDYRVGILYLGGNGIVADYSDGPFTISSSAPPTITVLSPSAGQECEQESVCDIQWAHSQKKPVQVDLYQNSAFVETISAINNGWLINWYIQPTTPQGANYQIKVTDANDPTVFGFSPSFEITGPPVPDQVTLNTPSDGGVVSLNGTLTWFEATDPDAESYDVEVWMLSCTGALDYAVQERVTSTGASTESYALAGQVGYEQRYYWRVRGVNNSGSGLGPWSETRLFDTEEDPNGWHLLAPPHNATGVSQTPTLGWQAHPGACSYVVKISEGGSQVFSHAVSGPLSTTYTVPAGALDGLTEYSWFVHASRDYDGNAVFTTSDDTWHFTTEEGLPTEPIFSLTPTPPLDFGQVDTGTTQPLRLTVENTGAGQLTGSFILSDDGGGVFSFSPGSLSFDLGPGAQHQVEVVFAPQAVQGYTGQINVSHNASSPPSPVTVSLTGAGQAPTEPVFSLTPTALNFGDVTTNATKMLTLKVENTGGGQLMGGFAIDPSSDAVFSFGAGSLSFDLGPGAYQEIEVIFAPQAVQGYTGHFNVSHNASSPSPATVPLTGQGQTPPSGPVFSLTPTSLDFEEVVINTTETLRLTVKNTGVGQLTGTFEMDPSSDAAFSFDPTSQLSYDLGPQEEQDVTVIFAPQATQGYTGTVIVTHNGPSGSSVDVTLAGEGTLSASPAGRYYYVTDHLGSVRATLNEAGTIVHFDDYYPFGVPMPGRSGGNGDDGDPTGKPRFTGYEREWEQDDAVYYAGARYYDALIGRFMSIDRFAVRYPSLTPYQYTANNPVVFIDVNGDTLFVNGVGEDGAEAVAQFERLSTRALGGFFTVDVGEDGLVDVRSTGREGELTSTQQAFLDALMDVASLDVGRVSLNLVMGSESVLVDDFASGQIDMADVAQQGNGPFLSAAGALGHALIEQKAKQLDNIDAYRQAHYEIALPGEANITGFFREANSLGSNLRIEDTGSLSGDLHIYFRNNAGGLHQITMKLLRNNIIGIER